MQKSLNKISGFTQVWSDPGCKMAYTFYLTFSLFWKRRHNLAQNLPTWWVPSHYFNISTLQSKTPIPCYFWCPSALLPCLLLHLQSPLSHLPHPQLKVKPWCWLIPTGTIRAPTLHRSMLPILEVSWLCVSPLCKAAALGSLQEIQGDIQKYGKVHFNSNSPGREAHSLHSGNYGMQLLGYNLSLWWLIFIHPFSYNVCAGVNCPH